MKTINNFFFLCLMVLSHSLSAQSPDKLSYQAVVRNAEGELLKEQTAGIRISILQSTAEGTEVYSESHNVLTNENGLISIAIGTGISTDNFGDIDWTMGPYFLRTEIDPEGGSDYSITASSQLLSVPYALHARTADSLRVKKMHNVSIPASALGVYPEQDVITPHNMGLQWRQDGSRGAYLFLKKPSDYTGGDVEFTILFWTSSSREGVVDFFVRPNSYNDKDDTFDTIGESSGGVIMEGGSKVYEQRIVIPANRMDKDWWKFTIQRKGNNSTFIDNVIVLAVNLSYY